MSGVNPLRVFTIELSAENGAGDPVATFITPLIISLTNTDEGLSAPEDTLALYYWHEITSTWIDTVTTCAGGVYTHDLEANILSLPFCHLTEFGLFGVPLYIILPIGRR